MKPGKLYGMVIIPVTHIWWRNMETFMAYHKEDQMDMDTIDMLDAGDALDNLGEDLGFYEGGENDIQAQIEDEQRVYQERCKNILLDAVADCATFMTPGQILYLIKESM